MVRTQVRSPITLPRVSRFMEPKFSYFCDILVKQDDGSFIHCNNKAVWDHNYSKYLMCDSCLRNSYDQAHLLKFPTENYGKERQDRFINKLLLEFVQEPGFTDC